MHEIRWLSVYILGGIFAAIVLGILGAPAWGAVLGGWIFGDSLANEVRP